VRCGDALGGERTGDLGEAAAVRVLEADPLDDAPRKRLWATGGPSGCTEADARTRTGDPFITSEVLYQLSYVGVRLL
jgi:hypothetical protein